MTMMKLEYVLFVPSKAIKGTSKNDNIYVFSHKKNKKIYKRKRFLIGAIGYNPIIKEWTFIPYENCNYSWKTMMIIARFLIELTNKEIIFDQEKGELLNEQNN